MGALAEFNSVDYYILVCFKNMEKRVRKVQKNGIWGPWIWICSVRKSKKMSQAVINTVCL
jgi:hypothetical protein